MNEEEQNLLLDLTVNLKSYSGEFLMKALILFSTEIASRENITPE